MQYLITPEEVERRQQRAERMDFVAGVKRTSFESIPTITVFNESDKPSEIGAKMGDLMKSVRNENGFENSVIERPMNGIVLKVRWYLKNKFKFNKQRLMSTEFDNFSPGVKIIIKEIITEDEKTTFNPIFKGNYKEVNDRFSLSDGLETEKKLDLYGALYVLTNFEEKTIVKVTFKGMSRSNFFYYMKVFDKKSGESMTQMYTKFDSQINTLNSIGKTMKQPVAAMTFAKNGFVKEDRLDILEEIQLEITNALRERDEAFNGKENNTNELQEGVQENPLDNSIQENPTEEIPTIQLDQEDIKQAKIELDDIDTMKVEDSPF